MAKKGLAMIYEDEFIMIEREYHEVPWVKIFTKQKFKEITDCDEKTRNRLFEAMMITEQVMRKFYNPTKINIASFGNFYPHVHIHVMARFELDSYYPNSVWGEAVRKGTINPPSFDEFCKELVKAL